MAAEKRPPGVKIRSNVEVVEEDADNQGSADSGQSGRGHGEQDRDLRTALCPAIEHNPSEVVSMQLGNPVYEHSRGEEEHRVLSSFSDIVLTMMFIFNTICEDAMSSFPLGHLFRGPSQEDGTSGKQADNSPGLPEVEWVLLKKKNHGVCKGWRLLDSAKEHHAVRKGQRRLDSEVDRLFRGLQHKAACSALKAFIREEYDATLGCCKKSGKEKPWSYMDMLDHFQPASVSALVFPANRQRSEGGADAGRGSVPQNQQTSPGVSPGERQRPAGVPPADGMEGTPWITFQQELYRLGTFLNLPRDFPVPAVRLAQAGFLRLANGSIVCYFCGLTRNEWTRQESPLQVHRQLRPDCPLLTDANCPNVAVSDPQPVDQLAEVMQNWSLQNGAGGGPSPSTTGSSSDSLQNGAWGSATPSSNTALQNVDVSEDGSSEDGAQTIALAAAVGPSPPTQTVPRQNEPDRRQPPRMGLMGGSASSANPERPPILDGTAQPAPTAAPAPTSTGRREGRHVVTYDQLGIVTGKPKRPEMATVQSRLATFTGWSDTGGRPSAVRLVEAGFYYGGYADCGRCFSCGGGLKSWEPTDDPWVAHARWFPGCAYVKQYQGRDFIDIVKELSGGDNSRPVSFSEVREEMRRRQVAGGYERDPLVTDPAVGSAVSAGFSQRDAEAAAQRMLQEGQQLSADRLVDYLEADGPAPTSASAPAPAPASAPAAPGTASAADVASQPEADANTRREVEALQSENGDFRQRVRCKVCLDREVSVVFLPCGHLVTCVTCSPALRACAVCRQPIKGRVRVFPG